MRRPALGRGLSGRILLLTMAFVLVGEVLIYLPSIARFRLVYLNERIEAAHLATIALDMGSSAQLAPEVKARLLRNTGLYAITLHHPMAQLMLGEPRPVDDTVDMTSTSAMGLIPAALDTLWHQGRRTLMVVGTSPEDSSTRIEVILAERPLWSAMVDYSVRILALSVVLSLGVALLLFFSLRLLIVRPLHRITGALAAFRERPEDATRDAGGSGRADEIGVVEREFVEMRDELRRALVEKSRLAALGAALGRMSHDLRNLLATAVLVSDRLETNPDPEVRRTASRLVETLDRAIRLCADTLHYATSAPERPQLRPTRLREVVERVRASLAERPEPVRWRIEIDPALELMLDGDQLHRVLLNLARNAYEAIGSRGGELRLAAHPADSAVIIEVEDDGPGIPARVRERLFEPFAGSNKPGGSGLGLAICRELMRAQGGEIALERTSPAGTIFTLMLPAPSVRGQPAARSGAMALRCLSVLLLAGLSACAWQGPSMGGLPGMQFKVVSFYENNALEQNAFCTQPRMDPAGAKVVEETPERVVMNVRYHWYDDTKGHDGSDVPLAPGGGGIIGYCNGWGERTFTLAKNTAGDLDVVSMTGPQRR